jgi:hypothetical protein
LQFSSWPPRRAKKGGEWLEMVYVAVDIGKRRCVMDQDGSILDTGSYPNTSFDASHYARQIVEKYGECKAVVDDSFFGEP